MAHAPLAAPRATTARMRLCANTRDDAGPPIRVVGRARASSHALDDEEDLVHDVRSVSEGDYTNALNAVGPSVEPSGTVLNALRAVSTPSRR